MADRSYSWGPIEMGQIDTTPILMKYPLKGAHTQSGERGMTKHATADVQLAAWIEGGKRWKREKSHEGCIAEIDGAMKLGKNYAGEFSRLVV